MNLSRMSSLARTIGSDRRGSPLAELALVLPFLIGLIFITFEAGRLLYYQQIITRSVQDAARFAARHPDVIDPASCVPGGTWSTVQGNAETIVRRGNLIATTPLIADLESGSETVSVTVQCVAAAGNMVTSNTAGGANTQIPIVIASASVPITNIGFFAFIGYGGGITLSAEHREQAIGL